MSRFRFHAGFAAVGAMVALSSILLLISTVTPIVRIVASITLVGGVFFGALHVAKARKARDVESLAH